ncbi:MAG: anti-sigma factor family protein [Pseudohaliea sp.]
MTDRDFELLSQYLDDELDSAARAALEQRLAAEPELADLLARLRRLDGQIAASVCASATDSVPEHVADLLREDDKVVPLCAPLRRAAWPAALAASVIAATALLLVPGEDGQQPLTGSDTLLAGALESEPSRAEGWVMLADGRALQPVLTFPSRDGSWCREFLLRDDNQDWRGVACRDAGNWQTQVVARETFLAAEEVYRPAGAGDNDKVAGFITRNAADIALGAREERALIASDWQDAR